MILTNLIEAFIGKYSKIIHNFQLILMRYRRMTSEATYE